MGVTLTDWSRAWVGCAWVGKGSKRACTVSPRAGAFPRFSMPLQPVFAASRLSSLSKRWLRELEVGEWPGLRK